MRSAPRQLLRQEKTRQSFRPRELKEGLRDYSRRESGNTEARAENMSGG
jgi:hypothetical protein